MRFDWAAFCRSYNIPFVTSGPNTARGNISIKCPFCGSADPSQHMGLRLDPAAPSWGCLRNSNHVGRNPARLVAALLHIQPKEAWKIVEGGATPVDDFEAAVEAMKPAPETAPQAPVAVVPHKPRPYPPEFKPLPGDGPYAARFLNYLASERGFGPDAPVVAETYRLHYALSGPQKNRLIIPILNYYGEPLAWQGRGTWRGAVPRYLGMPDMGKDLLLGDIFPEVCEFDSDEMTMLVCEGPLDYLKLDFYGAKAKCLAVATMGTSWTPGQLLRLGKMARICGRTRIVMDAFEVGTGMRLAEALRDSFFVDAKMVNLPAPFKDPGEMSGADVDRFCRGIQ